MQPSAVHRLESLRHVSVAMPAWFLSRTFITGRLGLPHMHWFAWADEWRRSDRITKSMPAATAVWRCGDAEPPPECFHTLTWRRLSSLCKVGPHGRSFGHTILESALAAACADLEVYATVAERSRWGAAQRRARRRNAAAAAVAPSRAAAVQRARRRIFWRSRTIGCSMAMPSWPACSGCPARCSTSARCKA